MKKTVCFIVGIGCFGGLISANGESLLKVASFPKTFNDLPFITRMETLADDYINFNPVYDQKDGHCISGCAYPGITIEKETETIRRNTELANDAMGAYLASHPNLRQNNQPEQSVNDSPETPGATISPNRRPDRQPVIPTLPNETQNCHVYRVVSDTDVPWNSPIDTNIIITSDFGPRNSPTPGATDWHKGIDIAVPVGTPVYATANGTVDRIRNQGNSGGGKYVLLKHDNGNFRTAYFHLSDNNIVKVGDRVFAGQLIGKSGNTGNSTGPHLDYRIFYTQPNRAFNWDKDIIDPLWKYNRLNTNYSFRNQNIKSCLHKSENFCGESSGEIPPETLPCEIK